MAKRKAGVNNIIYELENEDINVSDSDDECKDPKIICTDENKTPVDIQNCNNESQEINETIGANVPDIKGHGNVDSEVSSNGGKTDANSLNIVENHRNSKCENKKNGSLDDERNPNSELNNTILYNDDIDVDSPSNSDLGVVGCENRTPLVSVRFKDNRLAKIYKKQVKEFILKLIRLNENETQTDSDTDLELDVWPEDLSEEDIDQPPVPSTDDDNLFFVDTDPTNANVDVPVYEQASVVIANPIKEEETSISQAARRGPICFNCDGDHPVRDCPLPRNNTRIAINRRNIGVKLGRYHVEDEQKYGHLIPGRISGQLRYALGLKRYEIPMHIYRMRLLGYPPGWLEEARISHSGITMFDSTGTAILDPEEEVGEIVEPGSKDKFDIKKIVDFPGFNVPASSRYIEEGHLYGFPPISEQDSKMTMLQMLAPNAMKAYKRKKLTFFPSAAHNSSQESQEMELDDGDEIPSFPSVPPLPDDAPPAPPPPPSSPPPDPPKPKQTIPDTQSQYKAKQIIHDNQDNTICISDTSQDDIEIIEVMQVTDIPVPEDDLVTIDDDELTDLSSGQISPTIDDLEAKKRQLLDAIQSADISTDVITDSEQTQEIDFTQEQSEIEFVVNKPDDDKTEEEVEKGTSEIIEISSQDTAHEDAPNTESDVNKTPKTGIVKNTLYGTPVMNIASPYMKLPSDEKFAKDICDVIQFENLPNSVGKYKKISSLLKKVKSEVDRIQDS